MHSDKLMYSEPTQLVLIGILCTVVLLSAMLVTADAKATLISKQNPPTIEQIMDMPHHHWYKEYIKAPTCISQGITTHACKLCDDYYIDTVTPIIPHNYIETITQPTCTEEGYSTFECDYCHDIYIDNIADMLHHEYTDVITEPTCVEKGYTTHNCNNCEYTFDDTEVAELGHNYEITVIAPSPFNDGFTKHVCTRCGDFYQTNYVKYDLKKK